MWVLKIKTYCYADVKGEKVYTKGEIATKHKSLSEAVLMVAKFQNCCTGAVEYTLNYEEDKHEEFV